MKACTICNVTKPLNHFHAQAAGLFGVRADCKECRKRFDRSREGLVKKIYRHQKASSAKRGHQPPSYTLEHLTAQMLRSVDFERLYEQWVASGYDRLLSPSVDRKDNSLPYQAGNLRLVTFKENHENAVKSMKALEFEGIARAVDMLTFDGVFVRSFASVSEASRHFGGIPSNIVGAINKRVTSRVDSSGNIRYSTATKAYGHLWRYSGE